MTASRGEAFEDRCFSAVVFDLDGTLIDSHEATVRSYEKWAAEYGVPPDEAPESLGMPGDAVAAAVLPADDVKTATDRMEALEIADTEGVVSLPGAMDALNQLPRHRVAIATSCPRDLMHARMQAAGLPFPDVIVTRDQVSEGKPAPESFLLATQRLGAEPSRTLVVEDAPAGITAARAAGCAVLGIASTKRPDELQADAVVADLSEVEWILDTTGQVSVRLRSA